jgi:hypothetical protein
VVGVNTDIEGTYRINDIGSDHSWVYLTDVATISMPAERGDSGSLVSRRAGPSVLAAVGLLVAVQDELAIFQRIRSALRAFQSYEHLHLRLGLPGDI